MEKEKLLSELKAKVGTTALSDRTIDEYVTNILPMYADVDAVEEHVLGSHVAILKSFEGNLNHEVASKVNSFKAEWEKKNIPTPQTHPLTEEKDEKYELLMKEIESLKKSNEEQQKKSAAESLRNEVLNKGGELKVSNRNLWNDCVKSASVGEDAKADVLLEAVKKDYESRLKAYVGDGAIPYGGMQASQRVSTEQANAKREAFRAKMQSQGKLPK